MAAPIGMLDSFVASGGTGPMPSGGVAKPQQPTPAQVAAGQTTAQPPAIIPDAGVYGAETAAAVNAYNNAVAQAQAQRNALYNQYGLGNNGQVDPHNPYGEYEQMLNAQASQFQGDREDATARGLGRGGLANQAESSDRRGAQAQDYQFQQMVNQVPVQYQQALADALNTKQNAIAQAYNDAMNTALQNQLDQLSQGNYTAPGTGKQTDTSTPKPKGGGGSGGNHSNRPHNHRPRRGGGGGGRNYAS